MLSAARRQIGRRIARAPRGPRAYGRGIMHYDAIITWANASPGRARSHVEGICLLLQPCVRVLLAVTWVTAGAKLPRAALERAMCGTQIPLRTFPFRRNRQSYESF